MSNNNEYSKKINNDDKEAITKIINSIHVNSFYDDEIYDDGGIDIVEENSIRFKSKEEEEIFIQNFLDTMEEYFNTSDKKREEVEVEVNPLILEKLKKWLEEEE